MNTACFLNTSCSGLINVAVGLLQMKELPAWQLISEIVEVKQASVCVWLCEVRGGEMVVAQRPVC